jgi:1,4-alpha-glucan branching enzyme
MEHGLDARHAALLRARPLHRVHHHDDLTFGLLYAFSEQFVLPLSHDEVVHGKGSLLNRMPGDRWQKFANLRALYAHMWAHPGKKLLFSGSEFAETAEFKESRSLDWHLLDDPRHAGLAKLVADLNRAYRAHPALWEIDFEPAGFRWIDANDYEQSVLSYVRFAKGGKSMVVCLINATPVIRQGYRIGVPREGFYREVINTDAEPYGGSGVGNLGGVKTAPIPSHGFEQSVVLTLPPLATIWLAI